MYHRTGIQIPISFRGAAQPGHAAPGQAKSLALLGARWDRKYHVTTRRGDRRLPTQDSRIKIKGNIRIQVVPFALEGRVGSHFDHQVDIRAARTDAGHTHTRAGIGAGRDFHLQVPPIELNAAFGALVGFLKANRYRLFVGAWRSCAQTCLTVSGRNLHRSSGQRSR